VLLLSLLLLPLLKLTVVRRSLRNTVKLLLLQQQGPVVQVLLHAALLLALQNTAHAPAPRSHALLLLLSVLLSHG
jgi:hypothetical protein